jgi:hypothetical protein
MDRNAVAEAEAARKQVSRLSLPDLVDLLQSRRADWVVRDMALQRLLVIARNGGIEAETPDFKQIVSGLAEQVPDLRSQVVRSACAAIVELSCAVGDHLAFDRPLREVLLPPLIDLVSNGNKVLANAGKETLLPLFTNCHFQGMLKLLATSLKESKHPAVKHACCVCLAYALQVRAAASREGREQSVGDPAAREGNECGRPSGGQGDACVGGAGSKAGDVRGRVVIRQPT